MSKRESNIELLRIIAMLMIVLFHCNYYSLGAPDQGEVLTSPWLSFWRIFAEQICVVGVNVFVLISGWFGIKPSLKGLCSLLYQVVFWGVIIVLGGLVFHLEIPVKDTLLVFWFGGYYWFVIAYIGLYVLSPVLNAFIEKTSPRKFLTILICFFSVEFVYGWFIDSASFGAGYSIISFVGLYLLARYIRLHSTFLKTTKPAYDILIYWLVTIIPALISFLGIRNGWKQFYPLYYTSPFVIAAAVSLLLIFTKFEFSSKFVNWVGCSTFCVYLIHQHPVVGPHFVSLMQHLAESLTPASYSCIVVLLSAVFILACATLDKLRIKSWGLLSPLFKS